MGKAPALRTPSPALCPARLTESRCATPDRRFGGTQGSLLQVAVANQQQGRFLSRRAPPRPTCRPHCYLSTPLSHPFFAALFCAGSLAAVGDCTAVWQRRPSAACGGPSAARRPPPPPPPQPPGAACGPGGRVGAHDAPAAPSRGDFRRGAHVVAIYGGRRGRHDGAYPAGTGETRLPSARGEREPPLPRCDQWRWEEAMGCRGAPRARVGAANCYCSRRAAGVYQRGRVHADTPMSVGVRRLAAPLARPAAVARVVPHCPTQCYASAVSAFHHPFGAATSPRPPGRALPIHYGSDATATVSPSPHQRPQ